MSTIPTRAWPVVASNRWLFFGALVAELGMVFYLPARLILLRFQGGRRT